jgi:16S rRNA (guanine527-N7)-methyltransferase
MPQGALTNSDAVDLATDRAQALMLTPVSRETTALLDRFVEFLLPWTQKTNLIARSTVSTLWTRHIADSLQLVDLAPEAKCWVDLGSGAGFPGIVVACALPAQAGTAVHLIESNGKKATFLREAANHLGLPIEVHAVRIEDFVKNSGLRPDVVTARAVAPLNHLMELAQPLLARGATGLFSKGQHVEGELTQAAKCWKIDAELVPSKTNSQARIVVVRGLERRLEGRNFHDRSRR